MREENPTTNWPGLVAAGMDSLWDRMSVVQGYMRMLEKERAGPVTEKQRDFLQDTQKIVRAVMEIVDALHRLAVWEGEGLTTDMASISLGKLLSEVAGLPILQHLPHVDIRIAAEHDAVTGVFSLLRHALAGLAHAVALEQLRGERPLSIWVVDPAVASERWIVLAATDQIEEAVQTPRESLSPFDDRRRRSWMDVPFAGGVVRAHGGQLLALPTGVPGAVVALPRPTGE